MSLSLLYCHLEDASYSSFDLYLQSYYPTIAQLVPGFPVLLGKVVAAAGGQRSAGDAEGPFGSGPSLAGGQGEGATGLGLGEDPDVDQGAGSAILGGLAQRGLGAHLTCCRSLGLNYTCYCGSVATQPCYSEICNHLNQDNTEKSWGTCYYCHKCFPLLIFDWFGLCKCCLVQNFS